MSSIQRQNALDFVAGMDARDYNAMADLMSENFTHRFLPASLKGFGKAVRTKQEFLNHVKELESTFKIFNFQPPKETIQADDIVILHFVSDGETATGKPYNNEYLIIFRFEGEQIASIKEFMDSAYITQILSGAGNPTPRP